MGLLSKFGLLFTLLSAAVILSIASAAWAIGLLERELSWPLDSMQRALDTLHGARDELVALDLADDENRLSPAEARLRLKRIMTWVDDLGRAGSADLRVGISTRSNLLLRLGEMNAIVDRWEDGDENARREFHTAQMAASMLIGRIERRVIDDAALAVDFGDGLRRQVFATILISVLLTLATIGLSAVFVRRWVIKPVESIRAGAQVFAAGDLTHRVSVEGRDELGRLANDFNTMASRIDRLQTERIERERLAAIGEMLRRVVHNLRTPLAGIRGLAESSMDEAPASGDIKEMQSRIIASVDRFESWLRELLKSSTPLEIRTRPALLEPWIEDVVAGRRDAADAAGVEIALDVAPGIPESVELDADQMAHASVAVLDNAIQAAGPDGRVEITVSAADRPGCWVLSFSDSGPGIDAEHLGRIFEPSFTTKPNGTGIGLAMTRSIMEAHGGRIEVESCRVDAGVRFGTTIRLVLPCVRSDPYAGGVANTGQ